MTAAADNFFFDDAMRLSGEARDRVVAELRATGLPGAGDYDPISAAIDEAGWITQARPQYRFDVKREGWLTWSWQIVNVAISPHPVLEAGSALTEGSAWRRVNRAHGRLLDGAR